MARKSYTAQELDECGICLGQYTNPKTLPCLHSFCIKCIETLPQEPQVNTQNKYYYYSYIDHGLLIGRPVFHKLSFMS